MKQDNKQNTNTSIAYRVSVISIVINVVLTGFKLVAGFIGNSNAMISDAIHSLSDVFSTVVVMVGIKISGKAADDEHRYGHERIECVASIFLAMLLVATSFGIGYSGINKIISGNYDDLQVPTLIAAIAAVVSIITKEAMYHFTVRAAKKINSGALKADAWHHRSDALSSIGSLIGIVFAMAGFPVMDSVASIIICILILKAAYDIIKDALDKMIDKSCDTVLIEEMRSLIVSQEGVYELDDIKTRLFGNKIYVDIEICADGNLSLFEAHGIAEKVHDELEEQFPDIKHCMVHVNPK